MMQLTRFFPRPRYLVAGLGLLVFAALMPTGWYDALPRRTDLPDLPPLPFRGVDLLRLTVAVQGALLVWLATRRYAFQRISNLDLLPEPLPDGADVAGAARFTWMLVGVTVLALILRLVAVNADLWLDEITPILDYGSLPVAQVVGSYLRSNNHLLNTLLLKAMVALFGEHEWAVRLPAVLFGVATVPALYFVARLALSRAVSLAAALLLAVSYHHIFFSQNARGYTAYMFFAVVASGLFVRGLSTDRPSTWTWYVITIFLGFASLLNTLFVGAAHAIVGLIALWVVRRRGGSPKPLLVRLAWVFGVAGFLGFQLYATALPEMLVIISTVYASAATGFAPFNSDFLVEITRGISSGFGPGLLVAAIPFLAVAAAGYVSLTRRHWALTLALTLPGVLTALFLLVRGLTFSPRFFLLWLPLAIMAAAQGVWLTGDVAARLFRRQTTTGATNTGARIAGGVLAALTVVSLLALPNYYRTPKQPYRAALSHLDSLRGPGDRIAVIFTAEKGVKYYLDRAGADESAYAFVRSSAAFDSLRADPRTRRIIVLTTFRRALRIRIPDLHAEIERGWTPEHVFPGTVGDGSIIVWLPKSAPLHATRSQ